jgi:AcrR family transcriptional regulator
MGAATRDRILAAAARLFHEHGYAATGVAAILGEANINSGSLYHFFAGKEALLAGVLGRHLDALRPSLLEAAERTTEDPIERVFALLESYRRALIGSGFRRGCPVGRLALEIDDDLAQARALILSYFSEWIRGVQGWLEAAADRLPPELDRGALARSIHGRLQGAIMQSRAAAAVAPFDSALADLRSHLELLAERARRPAAAPAEPTAAEPAPAEAIEAVELETDWRSW